MERNRQRKEKKKTKRVIFSQPTGSTGARPRGRPRGPFSPDWYKQPGLKGLHSIPVNRPGTKEQVGSPGWETGTRRGFPIGIATQSALVFRTRYMCVPSRTKGKTASLSVTVTLLQVTINCSTLHVTGCASTCAFWQCVLLFEWAVHTPLLSIFPFYIAFFCLMLRVFLPACCCLCLLRYIYSHIQYIYFVFALLR
jgi:hypothetical protein